MTNLGKLLERLLQNRIMPYALRIPKVLDLFNMAYKPGMSPADAILVSKFVFSAAADNGVPLYQCWLDVSKAYDNIDWEILWAILIRLGLPANIIALVKALHVGARARVRINGELSEAFFELLRGLKQGSVFAPMMFLLYMGAIMMMCVKEFERLELGVTIVFNLDGNIVDPSTMNAGTFFSLLLSSVGFADDIKFIARSPAHLQQMILIFHHYCKRFGLALNVPKCECMVVHRIMATQIELRQRLEDELIILVDGVRLRVVNQAVYLGAVECDTNSICPELATRCTKLDN